MLKIEHRTRSDNQIGDGRREQWETHRGDENSHYTFRDFVLLRAVLARDMAPDDSGGGYPGFVSGWRHSALMHLRRQGGVASTDLNTDTI